MRKTISFSIGITSDVVEGWMEIFNKQVPAKDTRVGIVGIECEIAMVSVDVDVRSKENRMKSAESFDNAE